MNAGSFRSPFWRQVGWVILFWSILSLPFLLQTGIAAWVHDDFDIRPTLRGLLASYLAAIFLIVVFIIPLNESLRRRPMVPRLAILFFAGFVFSPAYGFLHQAPRALLAGEFALMVTEFPEYLLKWMYNDYKTYIYLTAIVFAYGYFQDKHALSLRRTELSRQLLRSELAVLRSQFHPHFLFNSLSSIVAVIDEQPAIAQSMLIHLSDLLRSSLESDFATFHSAADETAFLRRYLTIERLRFEEQLDYAFRGDHASATFQLPRLILQPLVENAIKHGYRNYRGILRLRVTYDEAARTVTVANDGQPLAAPPSFGHGLTNVASRLEKMTAGAARLDLYQEGDWVVSRIRFGPPADGE